MPEYLRHGIDSEAVRLDSQNESLAAINGRNPLHPAIRPKIESLIAEGKTVSVLDIATGTGCFAKDLIKTYPEANFKILLTDETDKFLKERDTEASPLPENVTIKRWNLYEDPPDEVRHFAGKDGFDVVNCRFIMTVVKQDQWPATIKRFASLVKPLGFLQHTEASHIYALSSDFVFDAKSEPELDALMPRDPIEMVRDLTTAFTLKMGTDRAASAHLVDYFVKAGFAQDKLSVLAFGIPHGTQLVPRAPLVTSSRTATGRAKETQAGSGGFHKLQDEVDLGHWHSLPQPVEQDENKLREAGDRALANGVYIHNSIPTHVKALGGIEGMSTPEELDKWVAAANAWLKRYTYYHPALFVAVEVS